jgi:hypothetical protein
VIQTEFTLHLDQVLDRIETLAWEKIRRLTLYFWQQVNRALNVSNPRPYDTPSQAGEPPRKRTGFLQRNVLYELDRASLTGRVGVSRSALYGLYLELGTARMRARPFIASTLAAHRDKLRAIAAA